MTLRLRLKFRVASLTINSHRGRHSQVSKRLCVNREKRQGVKLHKRSSLYFTRAFVWSVTTFDWTSLRGSSRGFVRGNTKRWRPSTTIFVRILLHQQYEAISTLFTGEPTYTLYFILFRAFCSFRSVFYQITSVCRQHKYILA